MDAVVVAGRSFVLKEIASVEKNKLWLSLLADFTPFCFEMEGERLLLLVKKRGQYSPVLLKKISDRVEALLGLSSVFYYPSLSTVERDRLVYHGVYFIIADKFAYLPFLISNRVIRKIELPKKILPSAQYVLLYHLQCENLNGKTLQEMQAIMPYKYATLSKSVLQLCEFGFASFESCEGRVKRLMFLYDKKALWEKARRRLESPLKKVLYCDSEINYGAVGGLSALSHYTLIAGETIPTRVLTLDECRNHINKAVTFEDIQRVEVWKYPPLTSMGVVDKLSLYLSFGDDDDPRVENELEKMINEMSW